VEEEEEHSLLNNDCYKRDLSREFNFNNIFPV